MYIREFVKLDDAINNTSKADIKGFSKNVAMAFNRMKQTIKKELKNAEFAQLVADFRANPIEESESEPEPSESESESESDSGSLYDSESESGSESGSGSESESESGSEVSDSENSDSDESYYDESYYDSEAMSSDSDFSSDSDSSDSDSDEEPNPKLTGRAKWVLQPKDIEKQKKKEEEKKKKEEEKKRKDEERKKLDKEKSELSDAQADAEVVQKTYETPEKLMTAVRSILETREKRSILSFLSVFLTTRRLAGSAELQRAASLRCRAGREVPAAHSLALHRLAAAQRVAQRLALSRGLERRVRADRIDAVSRRVALHAGSRVLQRLRSDPRHQHAGIRPPRPRRERHARPDRGRSGAVRLAAGRRLRAIAAAERRALHGLRDASAR